jgi:hypothetical protein
MLDFENIQYVPDNETLIKLQNLKKEEHDNQNQ